MSIKNFLFPYLYKMNIISGRILYGNSAGLNHNISGSITKFKTKKMTLDKVEVYKKGVKVYNPK